MAAPSFVQATTGATDTGGAWTTAFLNNWPGNHTAGNVVIVHVLQDGTTAGDVTISAVSNTEMEDLAGTDGVLTQIHPSGGFAVGSPQVARQFLWIGRFIATTNDGGVTTASNNATDDLYFRMYEFADVNTGTALSDVIENASAGSTANSAGTSATIADAGVTTLGPDRLACNFVGGNDDNALDAFTGMTGGTWAEATAEYADAGGTDGVIGLQTATMASAGTIDGGTDGWADATDGWGVVGFALIGTTVTATFQPRPTAIDFADPAVLMGGIRRAWHRRRSGIFVPEYAI